MICIILAAGYATRLYPLTLSFPKPLLEVNGKTILDWIIDDISENVSSFVVVSNHKYVHHFEEWASKKQYNISIIDDGTVDNDSRLGAVKDINLACRYLKIKPSEDYFIMAGDNLLDFSLNKFIDYFKVKNVSCVMRYFENDLSKISKSAELVLENDIIKQMNEKPSLPVSNWCCPPFYILKGFDLALIDKALEDGVKTDAPGSFISWLSGKTTISAFEMPGKRYDIGTVESYERIKKEYSGYLE